MVNIYVNFNFKILFHLSTYINFHQLGEFASVKESHTDNQIEKE